MKEALRRSGEAPSPYVTTNLAEGRTVSWLIENAPSEEALIEAAAFAQSRTGVASDLRRKWANLIQIRMTKLSIK